VYYVTVEAPRDGWTFSFHGASWFQNGNVFTFQIPSKPNEGSVFTVEHIKVYRGASLYETKGLELPITSGQISIKLMEQKVVVSLNDKNGAFLGNGEYPITFVERGASGQ
jgi:hypothetical protein